MVIATTVEAADGRALPRSSSSLASSLSALSSFSHALRQALLVYGVEGLPSDVVSGWHGEGVGALIVPVLDFISRALEIVHRLNELQRIVLRQQLRVLLYLVSQLGVRQLLLRLLRSRRLVSALCRTR